MFCFQETSKVPSITLYITTKDEFVLSCDWFDWILNTDSRPTSKIQNYQKNKSFQIILTQNLRALSSCITFLVGWKYVSCKNGGCQFWNQLSIAMVFRHFSQLFRCGISWKVKRIQIKKLSHFNAVFRQEILLLNINNATSN